MVWRVLILLVLGWVLGWVPGWEKSWAKNSVENASELPNEIEGAIRRSRLEASHLGVQVSKIGQNGSEVIYELNPARRFIPASLTKIVTAAAALENFPPGHKFVTTLEASAKVENGVLLGDIYLRGGGDPGFVSETMWFLVNEFVRNGVQTVQGNIVVDDSRFDQVRFDPGREPSRVDRAYDAPIGAMTFNWSTVNVYVRPGQKAGDPVRVFIDPVIPEMEVINSAKTSRPGSGRRIDVQRINRKKPGAVWQDVIKVNGTLAQDHPEAVYYKGITAPDLWSGIQLRQFLARRGINVKGQVVAGGTPKGTAVLAKAESKPLPSLVADMMKFSNNYVAEILTKNLAAELRGLPGTMEQGMAVLHSYLASVGIPRDRYEMTNPSGLSRKNAFTPRDLHQILVHLRRRFTVFPELTSSMPIGGVDGTLQRRMLNSPARGWVRAKTGQLDGVAGLAGYLGRPDGQDFAFVFVFNGPDNQVPRVRDLYDELATIIVR